MKNILWTLIAILWLFHVAMYFTPLGTIMPHLLAIRLEQTSLTEVEAKSDKGRPN